MDEGRNRLAVFGSIFVVAIAGVLALKAYLAPGKNSAGGIVPNEQNGAPEVITRESAPDDVSVPEVGDADVPENVAVPNFAAAAGPETAATFRKFALTASQGKFTPDTFIVEQGDTFHLEFTAEDHDYDFTQPDYGFKFAVSKGETKTIEFGVSATGKFKFYCGSCGGPELGPVGYLVVVNKKS